jgi:hypothetical protein
VHERRKVYACPAVIGSPCKTATRTVPPISTDGVPTIAAAGTSPHFSEPGSTIIELLEALAEAFFVDCFVCAPAVTGSNTKMINKPARTMDIFRPP